MRGLLGRCRGEGEAARGGWGVVRIVRACLARVAHVLTRGGWAEGYAVERGSCGLCKQAAALACHATQPLAHPSARASSPAPPEYCQQVRHWKGEDPPLPQAPQRTSIDGKRIEYLRWCQHEVIAQ